MPVDELSSILKDLIGKVEVALERTEKQSNLIKDLAFAVLEHSRVLERLKGALFIITAFGSMMIAALKIGIFK